MVTKVKSKFAASAYIAQQTEYVCVCMCVYVVHFQTEII